VNRTPLFAGEGAAGGRAVHTDVNVTVTTPVKKLRMPTVIKRMPAGKKR
jgi:hypothetical protein